MLILVPSTSSRSLWGMVIRLKKYCSKVTSLLMRPGSQLQSIQCGGSSFPLDIFGFPSFLYVYGARPYYQSFLEGHFDHYDLYLICAQLVRGGIPPRIAFPFVSCPLSLEFEPFITIWLSPNYSYSRPRPKTPQAEIVINIQHFSSSSLYLTELLLHTYSIATFLKKKKKKSKDNIFELSKLLYKLIINNFEVAEKLLISTSVILPLHD